MLRILTLLPLFLFTTASFCCAGVVLSAPHLSLEMNRDGHISSLFCKRSNKEYQSSNNFSGFVATLGDEHGNGLQEQVMKCLSFDGQRLVIGTSNVQVSLDVQTKEHYITFKIIHVHNPTAEKLMRLRLDVMANDPVALIPLDYMTNIYKKHKKLQSIRWDHIWYRTGVDPLGEFALFLAHSDEDFDHTLLDIWVTENLPHPKIDGHWTRQKATDWLKKWQEKFTDQSTLIIKAENPKELYEMTDFAAKIGIKKVYLHTDSWRGEYWPNQNSFLHIHRGNFPKGEADFKTYSDYCESKGLNLAIHIVSCAIGRYDPDYLKPTPDPRLASWVKGHLAQELKADATTIKFRPPAGKIFPRTIRHKWFAPNVHNDWMHLNMIQVGNEFIQVGRFEDTDKDVWTLVDCERGYYQTQAKAYPAETAAKGMYRAYGQAFTADSSSSLLDEVAQRYGEFCNRLGIDHMECDGQEIHEDVPWGGDKFVWKVYESLDHPVTSNTSRGAPLKYQIEYWFKSSQKVWNNHTTGGVAGGDGIPLYAHQNHRVATGPYEILFKPTQRLGMGGTTFNLIYPKPMFGINMDMIKAHGLSQNIVDNFPKWKEAAQRLSAEQKERIHSWFGKYHTKLKIPGNQQASHTLLRPETHQGELELIPLQMMSRPEGETKWGWGQEFGPLVPRQYIHLGQKLELKNAYDKQEPEFTIRAMHSLGEGYQQANSNLHHQQPNKSSIVDDYNIGAGHEARSSKSQPKLILGGGSLMPNSRKIHTPEGVYLHDEGKHLHLKMQNPSSSYFANKKGTFPHWEIDASTQGARGLGMTIHGDGSHAVLIVSLRNRGAQDFAVTLDFVGQRDFVIPCGQVAWSDPNWGWSTRHRPVFNDRIDRVELGLGVIPPNTNVDVKISNLRLMKEHSVTLEQTTIRLNNGSLTIHGQVDSDQYLWYKGGKSIGVYDLNWNLIKHLPITTSHFVANNASNILSIDAKVKGNLPPWFEVQFMVKDEPLQLP
jgi:hypothetical protein